MSSWRARGRGVGRDVSGTAMPSAECFAGNFFVGYVKSKSGCYCKPGNAQEHSSSKHMGVFKVHSGKRRVSSYR